MVPVLDPHVTSVRARVRAPELVGRGWLNTGGATPHLGDFRGKVLLLDFWTFCCVNCLHVLDELRPLEREFADVLVTVGVHSPKFVHEADPAALAAAVERYDVHHPVLDDPELTTWQAYAVKAWPTLTVVDPEGYVVHVAAGEGHAEALRRVIAEVVATHEAKGTLHRGDGPYVPPEPASTDLRFPAKAVLGPTGTLLVADSAHHRIVELDRDGQTLLRAFGTGERGRDDGRLPSFAEPSGLVVLPPDVAARVGYDVVVADTVNHLLRGLNLATGEVSTVAGTGAQWRAGDSDGPATAVDLTSPWDVAWWQDGVVVAMAGNHTLSLFDPVRCTIAALRGHHRRRAQGRAGRRGVLRPDLGVRGHRGPALAGRLGDLGAALDRRRPHRAHRRRHGPVRLRPPRRPRRAGAAAAPARRHRAGRRQRRRRGHLQRCHPPLRPGDRRGVDPGDRHRRAVRRGAGGRATWWSWPPPRTGSNGRSAGARLGRGARRTRCAAPPTELAPGDVELAVVFTPPPGPEPRRAVRPVDPAGDHRVAAGAAGGRRGRRHRADPGVGDRRRRSPTACCTSSRRPRAATTRTASTRRAT